MWVIEFVIKINSTLVIGYHLITKRQQVIIHYFKKRLAFDFVPSAIIVSSQNNLIQIFTFLKLINIMSELNSFQKYLFILIRRYYIVSLINLIFKIFIFAHVTCCMWYLITIIEMNILRTQSWVDEGIDIKSDWWLVQFQSLYWALTLMTTGSNIATTTTLQIIFTSSTIIFTIIAFGYLLNVVGFILFILETIDKQSEEKRSNINILNEYLRKKNISKSLQQKINLNLEYYYNRNIRKIHQDSIHILDKIPSDLKCALNKEFNHKIISKISVLKDNFSEKIIDQLCQVAKEEYYLPNQVICDGSQALETSLICIVSAGFVKEINCNKLFSSQIQQGRTCCEIYFFTGVSLNNIIKPIEYTQILRKQRNDFINIVRKSSQEIEVFCQIRDRILIYEQYSCINVQCQIYNQSTHLMLKCPMVHYQKNFTTTKIGFTKSQNQIRKKSDRKPAIKRKFYVINQNDIQYCIFQEKAEIQDYHFKVLSHYLNQQNKENSNSESEESQESIQSKINDQIFYILQSKKMKKNQNLREERNQIESMFNHLIYGGKLDLIQYFVNLAGDSLEIIQSDSDKYIKCRDKNKQFQYVARKRTESNQEDPKSEQNLKLIESEKPINLENFKKAYTNQLSSQNNFQQLVQMESDEVVLRNQKKHEIALKQYSHDLTLKQHSHDLTYKQISSFQSNIKNSQNFRFQQICSYKMMIERDKQYYSNFEKLQDFNHYFRNGNSGLRIQKCLKFQMKMQMKTKKQNNKQS
ncbi:hypothetical protein ABPG72_021429 [Tetrahymena utriculariae]